MTAVAQPLPERVDPLGRNLTSARQQESYPPQRPRLLRARR